MGCLVLGVCQDRKLAEIAIVAMAGNVLDEVSGGEWGEIGVKWETTGSKENIKLKSFALEIKECSAKINSNWFQVVRTISDPFEAFEVLFYSTFLTRLASSKASMSVIRYSTFPTIFK